MEASLLILLAEDEALIALTIEDALQEAGFAVHHVLAGEDALVALEKHEHAISGVITDIKLQGAIDGWAIARKAREMLPTFQSPTCLVAVRTSTPPLASRPAL